MSRLDLTSVRIEGGAIAPVTNAEVDDVEGELGVTMPAGYREYVTTLGAGTLDMLVRVLPPKLILGQVEEHRSRFATGWFWDPGDAGFGQDAAMTSIPIADTLEGDDVTLWPGEPSRLFILPRHEERVIARPADLLEVVDWICSGGLGHEPTSEHVFTPWVARDADRPPRDRPSVDLGPPPDLSQPPRDVLLAYFAELGDVESWAATHDDVATTDELMARSVGVHARYGTTRFATSMTGGSVTVTEGQRQAHDPRGVRVVDETPVSLKRVRIRAAHGEPYGEVNDYVLERSGDEWRIASMRFIDVTGPPPRPGLGEVLRRLFRRD